MLRSFITNGGLSKVLQECPEPVFEIARHLLTRPKQHLMIQCLVDVIRKIDGWVGCLRHLRGKIRCSRRSRDEWRAECSFGASFFKTYFGGMGQAVLAG